MDLLFLNDIVDRIKTGFKPVSSNGLITILNDAVCLLNQWG